MNLLLRHLGDRCLRQHARHVGVRLHRRERGAGEHHHDAVAGLKLGLQRGCIRYQSHHLGGDIGLAWGPRPAVPG